MAVGFVTGSGSDLLVIIELVVSIVESIEPRFSCPLLLLMNLLNSVFYVTLLQIKLYFEYWLDLESNYTLDDSKSEKGPEDCLTQPALVNLGLGDATIPKIHEQHECFQSPHKRDNHDLAIMYCSVAHVVNPAGEKVQDASQESE